MMDDVVHFEPHTDERTDRTDHRTGFERNDRSRPLKIPLIESHKKNPRNETKNAMKSRVCAYASVR